MSLTQTPIAVTDVEMAFGARAMDLLPPMHEIPDGFDSSSNQWNRLVSRWFMSGLPASTEFNLKHGVDGKTMLRHLKTVLGSFEPKHEHKIAGAAYLLSSWCDSVMVDGQVVES